MKCLFCGKEIGNKKYCSKKCHNSNRKNIKNKSCELCGEPTVCYSKYCSNCSPVLNPKSLQITLGKYKEDHKGNKANTYSLIRYHARKVTKNREQKCAICGWSEYVEVCHIKDIKNFNDDTIIADINADDNLILLCPNCHWELDNGHLKL